MKVNINPVIQADSPMNTENTGSDRVLPDPPRQSTQNQAAEIIAAMLKTMLDALPPNEHLAYSHRILPISPEINAQEVLNRLYHALLLDEHEGVVNCAGSEVARDAIRSSTILLISPETAQETKSLLDSLWQVCKNDVLLAGEWLRSLSTAQTGADAHYQDGLIITACHRADMMARASLWQAEAKAIETAWAISLALAHRKDGQHSQTLFYAVKAVKAARSAASFLEYADHQTNRAIRLRGINAGEVQSILNEPQTANLLDLEPLMSRRLVEMLETLLQQSAQPD
jgi:hypothetical protein